VLHISYNFVIFCLYYRTATIDCLTEIASLPPHDIPEAYRGSMQQLLVLVIENLSVTLPRSADLAKAYDDGTEAECLFVKRLALFLGTYLKSYLPFFDNPNAASDPSGSTPFLQHEAVVVEALVYMVRVTSVEDEDIFKTCLEFWSHFAKDLYNAEAAWKASGGLYSGGGGPGPGMSMSASNNSLNSNMGRGKASIYETVLHHLRILIIDHMAKPEEVIIVEDENGEIVREMTKDTEVIAQYKTMRETIVYLTNLNYEDTEAIMLEKLDLQVAGGMFSWNGLNTLCWAIGSISGAMGELDEKRFLVSVIKDLLRLCEEQRGKDNKAVVASNIMYIVGQYPRFLRAHWKFLKTVVNKLFEFMHEHHPGVQDMACDTFLKIAQKCKRKFMVPQTEDPQPFVLTLIADLQKHIADLQPHQVQSFYESVGTMLSDREQPSSAREYRLPRNEVILRLMELQNLQWTNHMREGAQNVQSLIQMNVIKDLSRILRINTRVCTAAGSCYLHQLSNIFNDVLNVYRLYSEQVTAAVAQQGAIATRLTVYKAMRAVKTDILELLTACLEACNGREDDDFDNTESSALAKELFNTNFMPSILNEVLQDYHTSPPTARDHHVLSLFSKAISVLKDQVSPEIPRILNAIFEKTLEMITTNMLDYPEHRIGFFMFLQMANAHCFYALFSIPTHLQKLVIDSIVWAIKHTERNISETGLVILNALLHNISSNQQIAQPFYVAFLLPLLQDVFGVLTDRLHKSGFKEQASILRHLCHATQLGHVTVPLHSMGPNVDNAQFLKEHLGGLLVKAFPNITKAQVGNFVYGLFDVSMDENAFKQHLRDFLITIKEFESEDNSELFAEEAHVQAEISRQEQWEYMASVPGLLKPTDIENDPDL
jgi:exportin-1